MLKWLSETKLKARSEASRRMIRILISTQRFALLASLRLAIFSQNKEDNLLVIFPAGVNPLEKVCSHLTFNGRAKRNKKREAELRVEKSHIFIFEAEKTLIILSFSYNRFCTFPKLRLLISLNFKIFGPTKSSPKLAKHIVRKWSPSPRSDSLPLHMSIVSWILLTGIFEFFRGESSKGEAGGPGVPPDGDGTFIGTDSMDVFAVRRCPSKILYYSLSQLNFFNIFLFENQIK